jgi:hypothetical protein
VAASREGLSSMESISWLTSMYNSAKFTCYSVFKTACFLVVSTAYN